MSNEPDWEAMANELLGVLKRAMPFIDTARCELDVINFMSESVLTKESRDVAFNAAVTISRAQSLMERKS